MNRVREARSNRVVLFAALFAALLTGIIRADASYAAVYDQTYTYGVTDQSMWGSGQATAISYSQFYGTSWDRSLHVGDVTSTTIWNPFGDDPTIYAGAELSAHTAGRIGVDVGATVSSGSVDISQQSTIRLDAPSVISSSQQLFVSSAAMFGTGTIATQSPTASAYVDLVFELEADVSAQVCVVGCTGYSGTLVNVDSHPELLALNRNNDGQTRILGANYGLPLDTSVGPIDVTLNVPQIATSGSAPPQPLASSGSSDFIDVSLDVVGLASTSLGVPLSGSLGPISYSLLSAGLGLDLGVYQDFSFASNAPEITLNVAETGLSYSFLAGQNSPVIDTMGYDLLSISSSIDFSGVLSNDTGIELSPYVYMDILSASAFTLGIGPVFSWSSSFGNLPISLYDGDFVIDFGTWAGPSFQVAVQGDAPEPVPEPGTLILLGSGLASLAGFRGVRGRRGEAAAQ